MTATPLERLFGRSRQDMSTGRHAQVIREAAAPGERRRYTKRFLATPQADLRPWTARESRILAHLKRRGVRSAAELIGLDAGAMQTFDAGVTVEQWATMLPVEREGHVLPHVFADCAHWWALAHHTLRALESLHSSDVVHLEVKPDNICVPALGGDHATDNGGSAIGLKFARLALIDFAFALSPVEPLASPLPLGGTADQPYQSPRLLRALAAGRMGNLRRTQVLDWRCDLYSLAAMLRRYLPPADAPFMGNDGWTDERHGRALALLAALDDAHDAEIGPAWPHQALIEACEAELQEPELVGSLLEGFRLAPADVAGAQPARPTPPRSIVAPVPIMAPPMASPPAVDTRGVAFDHEQDDADAMPPPFSMPPPSTPEVAPPFERPARTRRPARLASAAAMVALTALAIVGLRAYDQRRHDDVVPPIASAEKKSATAASATTDETRPDAAREDPSRDASALVARSEPAAPTPARASLPAPQAAQPAATPRPVDRPTATVPARAAVPAPARSDEATIAAVPARAVDDVATQTERDVARVLAVAARATSRADDARVVQVARTIRPVATAAHAPTESPALARRLNADARAAWEHGDIDRAVRLQQRAFRANPNDAEITGNLAFYYLKVRPAQPALARRLALYALAARGQRFPAGRVEDWGTLAVASSLEGRQADAIKAMYVMSTVSSNPERACRAARLAVAQYGESMKAPADALLARLRESRSAQRAPSCG